jgi:hypothetical protein
MFSKKYKFFIPVILILLSGCNSNQESPWELIFKQEKAKVEFTYFFNSNKNSEVSNLDIKLDLAPSKMLNQPLNQDHYTVNYDPEGEDKTRKSLESYLDELKNYIRYTVDFNTDNIKFRIYATEKLDIIHIQALNKYNDKYRFMDESYFVQGTILKTTQSTLRSNAGSFDNAITEKNVTNLFDENKLFFKSIEKDNQSAKKIKTSNKEALKEIEQAFLLRQFCKDALVRLKDSQPEWFN